MFKKILSFFTAFCLTVGILASAFSVSAENIYKGKISIDTVSAVTGDTIIVPIRITENPGLMATTISITYDSAALELNYYYKGNILRDYTVVPHPDKNIIRFVNCESADKTSDGVLVNLQFKVKDTAEAGFHKMSIEYNAGDFCNWDLDRIMPEIIPGGVEVAFNGNNCSHKTYGEWTVAAQATCEEKGADQRICKTCGHVELRDTEPKGHTYSDKWTIDQPATAEQDGIMTRYCVWCTDYVDRITFSLQQSEEGEIRNDLNAETPNSNFIENIFKEQNPGKELTASRPLDGNSNTDSNSSDSSNTVSQNNDTDKNSKNNITDNKIINDTIDSVIGSLSPEAADNEITLSDIISKISEVFPNFETLTDVFKVSLAVLIALVL